MLLSVWSDHNKILYRTGSLLRMRKLESTGYKQDAQLGLLPCKRFSVIDEARSGLTGDDLPALCKRVEAEKDHKGSSPEG